MKKILTLLAIFMVAVTSWADDEITWTEVSTAKAFYDAINTKDASGNYNANVRLTADIDLSSHSASNDCIFNIKFKGKIDGEYTRSDGKKSYHMLMNSSEDLLFNDLDGAVISHLIINNCSFNAWDTHSGWIGTQAYSCTFSDIFLVGCSGIGDNLAVDKDYVGGLIGISHNCTFTNISVVSSHIETDGEYAGLIVGKDEGSTFTNCSTVGNSGIWADGNANNAYCGGICGMASGSTFIECVNMAVVASKDDRTGGIVGYATGSNISKCKNWGIVCHAEKEGYKRIRTSMTGEISSLITLASGGTFTALTLLVEIGQHVPAMVFSNFSYWSSNVWSILTGDFISSGDSAFELINFFGSASLIELACVAGTAASYAYSIYLIYYNLYQADELGGIAGTLAGGSVVNACANYGGVSCQDVECGGIVGYLDGSTVKNSLNRGLVDGVNKVGGIAGYCCNSATLKGNINLAGVNATSRWTGNCGSIYDITDADAGTKANSANNYYVNGTTASAANGCIGETPANFATGSVALAINNAMNDTIWHQNLGNSMYPVPEASSKRVTAVTSTPCEKEKVYTAGDLYMTISNPYAIVSIENDISLDGSSCFCMSSEKSPFRGKIYGNGHKLSNFSYEVPCPSGTNKVPANAAMFPFATGATFENFTINNFHLTQQELDFWNTDDTWSQSVEALLVANSTSCYFTNINIKNSTILLNGDKDHLINVGGLVANSTGDTFTGCSLDGDTQLQAYSGTSNDDILLGGVAGVAVSSAFSQCYSSATIWGDDNCVGGIVGKLSNGSIDQCLNTGCITAQESVGGIVGCIGNSTVYRCVNTGVINDDDNTRESYRAGVAGVLFGSNAVIDYCWNFGSVNYAGNNCGQVAGPMKENAHYGEHTYWYCQYNGSHSEKLPSSVSYSDITSGEYALTALYSDSKTWLYQYIDNSSSFPSHMPVPIAAAGTVYSNILCDGTQSYSNVYKSTASHTSASTNGVCSICGDLTTLPTTIHITNGVDLNDVARFVNSGKEYTSPTVYLDNDIDMSGFTFTPIGNESHPFKGTVYGSLHSIKNLAISGSKARGTGLFGFVSDFKIDGVVLDKSCTVTQTYDQLGTAGLIGCVKTTSDSNAHTVTITNCGNEANVASSGGTTAGLVGDILLYETDGKTSVNGNLTVTIGNCYNSGNISGKSGGDSGSIVGYANAKTSITNTWNSGTISGHRSGYPFVGYWSNNGGSLTNCYDVNTVSANTAQSNVTLVTSNDVNLGILCNTLNTKRGDYSAWTQDLGTDSHPTFGTAGIHYSREMSNNWGTIVLPFDITYDADNTNCNLYYLSGISSDALTFTEYEDNAEISAGTPMVIKKLSDGAIDVVSASGSDISTIISNPITGNLTAKGTYTETSIGGTTGNGVYFIAQDKFWRADAATTVKPFRAWFEGTLSSGAKLLSIVEVDEADGIDLIPALSQGEGVRKYLEGGKVVIVRNGKKFNINGQVLK